MNKLLIISVFSIVFLACNKPNSPNCLKSTGEQTSVIRNLDSFNSIILDGKLNLHLIQSNTNKVEIKGGKNLISKIVTSVNNNTLQIDNENTCNFVRSYKKSKIDVYLYFTDIKKLNIKGANNIFSTDTIFADNLKLEIESPISTLNITVKTKYLDIVLHDTAGELKIKGSTNTLYTWNSGISTLDFRDLKAGYTYFVAKSQNTSYLHSIDRLDVDLYEQGDVYYYGSPTKINERNYSNSAKLIKVN